MLLPKLEEEVVDQLLLVVMVDLMLVVVAVLVPLLV